MDDKPFRVLLDLTDLNVENFKYVWINISPRELKNILDFKQCILRKLDLQREDIQLFVRDGLLLEEETIIVLREDDNIKIKYKEQFPNSLHHVDNSLVKSKSFSRKRCLDESNISDLPTNPKRHKPDIGNLSSNLNKNNFEGLKKKKHKKSYSLAVDNENNHSTPVEASCDNDKRQKRKDKKKTSITVDNNGTSANISKPSDSSLSFNIEDPTLKQSKNNVFFPSLSSDFEEIGNLSSNLNENNVEGIKGKSHKKSRLLTVESENNHSTPVVASCDSDKNQKKKDKKKSSITVDNNGTNANISKTNDSFLSFNIEDPDMKQSKNNVFLPSLSSDLDDTAHDSPTKNENIGSNLNKELVLNESSNISTAGIAGLSAQKNDSYHEFTELSFNESSKMDIDINKSGGLNNNCPKKKRKRRRKRKQKLIINKMLDNSSTTKFTSFSESVKTYNKNHIQYSLSPDKIQEDSLNDINQVQNLSTNTFVVTEDKNDCQNSNCYPKISTPAQSDGCSKPNWHVSLMPIKNSVSCNEPSSFENRPECDNSVTKEELSEILEKFKGMVEKSSTNLPVLNSLPEMMTHVALKTLELEEYFSPGKTDYRNLMSSAKSEPLLCDKRINVKKMSQIPGKCKGKFKNAYDDLPNLNSFPEIGTHIAYKVLELGESYTPEVTDYREGIVKNINPDNEEIEIDLCEELIIPGKTGKFENLLKDETPKPVVKTYDVVKWCNIISPKFIL